MFGHAASRWGSRQGENIATSALVYLLNSSPEANRRFCSRITGLVPSGSSPVVQLRFVEQLIAGGGRIDAAGISPAGTRALLIECKFGAVLGDGQISSYLNELARPGVLLFIVPRTRRVQTMQQACGILGIGLDLVTDHGEHLAAPIDQATVAVTDWVSVLDALAHAHETPEFAAELAELRAYVELMTGDKFTPLAPEDLSSEIGVRWAQYAQLVDEAVNVASSQGILEIAGSLGAGHGYSGRAVRFGRWMSWAGLNALAWAEAADTPLWLDFSGPDRPDHVAVTRALQPLEVNDIRRIFESRGKLMVALYPKVATDRDEVVRDLVEQIRRVRNAIDAFLEQPGDPEPASRNRNQSSA